MEAHVYAAAGETTPTGAMSCLQDSLPLLLYKYSRYGAWWHGPKIPALGSAGRGFRYARSSLATE